MKKNDLRVQKTDMALTEALIKLLEKKSFESITVNELCDLAMIRRATFYTHFEDKYALLYSVMEKLQEEWDNLYKQKIANSNQESLCNYLAYVLEQGMDFFVRNKRLIKNTFINPYSTSLPLMIENRLKLQIINAFQQYNFSQFLSDEMRDLLATVLSASFITIALWYQNSEKDISREEILVHVDSIMEKLLA